MKLDYEFTESAFVKRCAENIKRSNTTINQDILQAIAYFLSNPKDPKNIITDIKHPYGDDFTDMNHERYSLPVYIEAGYLELYYVSIDIYTDIKHPVKVVTVLLPDFIQMESIEYGGNVKRKIKIEEMNLKKANRVRITFLNLIINKNILKKIEKAVKGYRVDLLPDHYSVWSWKQTFFNKITGKSYFCTCFKKALQKDGLKEHRDYLIKVNKKKGASLNLRSPSPHPHYYYAVVNNSFKKGICHLCSGKNSDLFYCSQMYCSSFRVKYGAYIKKTSIEQDIDEREAENIVREMKGIPKIGERWISETMLFNYIDILFPQYTVQREASPAWLGQQRLDIFIPELNLAIEYQGQQHYHPVDLFGGEEGLIKTKERDKIKAKKCKAEGIELIYFTYEDELSENLVSRRLKKYLDHKKSGK